MSTVGEVYQMKTPFINNIELQNAITLKMTDTVRKNFIFIPSDSVALQNSTEIQGGQVNCCTHSTWNDPKHTNAK
jgi:hypothetical protein